MKLSNRVKFLLFSFLIILNFILRLQVRPREIGYDSIEMHIMAVSLSEFGYAKWFLDPMSIVGIYPASYTSAMHFLISGISQTTGLGMNSTIFMYTIFLGIISIFIAYSAAKVFINDDVFAFFSALCFSTSLAVLNYTTWTIPARGLFVIFAPIVIYLLLKNIIKINLKYLFILLIISLFLFTAHHLFYFLLPIYFSFLIIIVVFKTRLINVISLKEKLFSKFNNKDISNYFTTFLILMGFLFTFSIPFITKKFLESSRYDPIFIGYLRYTGVISLFAIGGIAYLIFKKNKNSKEWFMIISMMLLMVFIFKVTYMKYFLPIITIIFISIALLNITKVISKRKNAMYILTIFLLISLTFSGYYQFLHDYGSYGRGLRDSTYITGNWIKYNIDSNCISNDNMLGRRLFSISETTHFVDSSSILVQVYGFCTINISDYERYPLSSDDFWLSGYEGEDVGEKIWFKTNILERSPYKYNINYVVENTNVNGNVQWRHQKVTSEVLELAYNNQTCIYDIGRINIWKLK
ncbi:MAG: hypothetical protein C5S46_06480 [Candidatus Methanomarinus sp.]|uniref:Uncharacterized protein n=1 Tax=Candidatus Methanomarinus sp. TaxID=3386244 RepID=A0AC61S988_9EURY|nr:MAG: hypothetical protein C5S46_06480 [ANME-2 cluster archaeon]